MNSLPLSPIHNTFHPYLFADIHLENLLSSLRSRPKIPVTTVLYSYGILGCLAAGLDEFVLDVHIVLHGIAYHLSLPKPPKPVLRRRYIFPLLVFVKLWGVSAAGAVLNILRGKKMGVMECVAGTVFLRGALALLARMPFKVRWVQNWRRYRARLTLWALQRVVVLFTLVGFVRGRWREGWAGLFWELVGNLGMVGRGLVGGLGRVLRRLTERLWA